MRKNFIRRFRMLGVINQITGIIVLATLLECDNSPMPGQEKLTAVEFNRVQLQDNFWRFRWEKNRKVTIPHAIKNLEVTGIVDNFRLAGDSILGEQKGNYPFEDSDVFKVIEGISYSLRSSPDSMLENVMKNWVTAIQSAQEDDGYLFTARTNKSRNLIAWAGNSRWSKLQNSHELYNSGHLYEAARAHFESTGSNDLMTVAVRNADLVLQTFGKGAVEIPPGHQEIEIGMMKLHQIAGDPRYYDLARYFLELRGHKTGGRKLMHEYAQDHESIFAQNEVVGHAVRALYMYSAMTDILALTRDSRYKHSVEKLWDNLVNKKMHLTGGFGSEGMGESFGRNYELPNMTAYNESCASIANILWQHRLFLMYADAKYIDVLERTLYNAFLSGVSLNGDTFFYDNPLASSGQHKRSPWFYCNCCISNYCRIMPTIAGYIYATRRSDIYVNLFISSETEIGEENPVQLSQTTGYPFDGNVRLEINPVQQTRFTLYVRIPGWVQNAPVPGDLYYYHRSLSEKPEFSINGEKVIFAVEKGYAKFNRIWQPGDTLEIKYPMSVRWILANPQVSENNGRVALQRGPLVFCLEGVDQPDNRVLNTFVDPDSNCSVAFNGQLLNGIPVITGNCLATEYIPDNRELKTYKKSFYAIPYYAWAHRGRTEMAVWLATTADKTKPLHAPGIAETSTASSSGGHNLYTLNDMPFDINKSAAITDYFFWDRNNDSVWVQYDFQKPESVSRVQVYWIKNDNIQFPVSWRILAWHADEWKPVWNPDRIWDIREDGFSEVYFETVKTRALRLEAVLQESATSGIAEWGVY